MEYKNEFAEQARKLCLLGATDKEIADFFKVDESVIENWKTEYDDFNQSIRDGRILADMNVAEALYKSAIGDVYVTEEKTILVDGVAEVVTLKRQIAPSVVAQIFWLCNRQPDKWADKVGIEAE